LVSTLRIEHRLRMLENRELREIRMGKSYTWRVLVGKPKGKRTLGGPRHKWILKWILKKCNGRA